MSLAQWDWRNARGGQDWTTLVKDQGGCGSCPAFACIAAMESLIKITNHDSSINPDLSEAHLFFCNSRKCKSKDPNFGWNPPDALNYLQKSGVPNEKCYPYISSSDCVKFRMAEIAN